MTDKEAKQIVLKYLVMFYCEESGAKLFLENKSKLFTKHGLAWSLGQKSLQFFCEFFLHDIYFDERCKPLSPIHYEMWAEMQDMILNKTHERQCYILPRGTAKTTITMGVAIWAAAYGFKSFIVIASALADTANSFIRNIRNAVENNEYINHCFGALFDRRYCTVNQEQIEFKNKTMIQSISAASSLRGKQYNNKRIELCLLDDYQKADETATEEQRNKKWKRFSDDVAYAMQGDNSTIIALGTLQTIDDFYDRVRKSPSFKTKQEKCIPMEALDLDKYFSSGLWKEFHKIYTDITNEYRLDDATEFYLQNKDKMQFPMLWADGWDCLEKAMKYFDNLESFHQEMQGEIERIGQKLIKNLSAIPSAEIENIKFDKVILSVDPAASTKQKSDYFAFCVLGQADNKILYARKSIIKKLDYSDYINQIIELLLLYPDISNISIEKNTYMGADVRKLLEEIANNIFLSERRFNIINESRTRNKDNRINTIIPDINNSRIIFNADDTEAIAQIKEFAGCDYTPHDDMIDCVCDAVEHIGQIQQVPKLNVLSLGVLGL